MRYPSAALCRSWLLRTVLFAAGASAAWGQDPEKKPDAADRPSQDAKQASHLAAEAALTAWKAGAHEDLHALASRDAPDPWLVAQSLSARGEHDAAEAFAKAAPRKDVEGLCDYVRSRRGKTNDAAARARLNAARAALARGDPAGALEAAGTSPATDDPLVSILLAHARGAALARLGRLAESVEAHLKAAKGAAEVRWLSCESVNLQEAGANAYARSDFPAALEAWQQRLRVDEARGNRRCIVEVVGNLGIIYFAVGDYAKALAHYEQARSASEELGDREGVATNTSNIGIVHCRLGDYAQALACQERALEISEELGDRAGIASSVQETGLIHDFLGNYPQALACQERALKLREELGDAGGASASLANIGVIHLSLGNYPEALVFHERALKIIEETGDRARAAGVLGNLGTIHGRLGDYPRALSSLQRSLGLAEELGDRHMAAVMLGNIGDTYMRLGDFPRALSCQQKALVLKEALGDRPGVALTLGRTGNVHLLLGDFKSALANYDRALQAMEELKDRAGIASCLANTGNVHYTIGDHAKALAYLERAVPLMEELGNHAGLASVLCGIGLVHEARGDHAKALFCQERALALSLEARDQSEIVRGWWNIGSTRLAMGDPAGAATAARSAVEVLGRLASGLAEEEGAKAREQFSGLFDVGTQAALSLGDASEACFFVESGRAATLLELLGGRDALWSAAVPARLRDAEALARAAEALAARRHTAARERGVRSEIDAARQELDEAQEKVAEVIARIQREAKSAAGVVHPKAASLDEIQGWLKDGEALLLYALHGEEAAALLVTREKSRLVRLGKTAGIETLCGDVRAGLARRPERAGSAAKPAEDDPTEGLDALRAAIVTPLELGEGIRRVFVSPHGGLSYVPFVLLCGGREVVYAPSATTYGMLREIGGAGGRGVLALGDPDLSVPVSAEETLVFRERGDPLGALKGARDEARSIGDVVLLGTDATPLGLAREVARRPRWRSVHLACHAVVDAERPQFSSLVLTGAHLATMDVFRARFPADLVVLSACETGRGKVYRSEGIAGFVRAFMFAGAPRVIVSLWKVDDEATRALMIRFYGLFNPKDGAAGLPAAEALRNAMEFVRDHPDHPEWKHPYYWAAWQIWGLAD
ncbi:MAG: tetratricopeptide repeat protein [Planctomycetota bacterium]